MRLGLRLADCSCWQEAALRLCPRALRSRARRHSANLRSPPFAWERNLHSQIPRLPLSARVGSVGSCVVSEGRSCLSAPARQPEPPAGRPGPVSPPAPRASRAGRSTPVAAQAATFAESSSCRWRGWLPARRRCGWRGARRGCGARFPARPVGRGGAARDAAGCAAGRKPRAAAGDAEAAKGQPSGCWASQDS